MDYLLDTNAISEWVKPRPDPGVVRWFDQVDEDRTWLSVITLGVAIVSPEPSTPQPAADSAHPAAATVATVAIARRAARPASPRSVPSTCSPPLPDLAARSCCPILGPPGRAGTRPR